MGPHFPRRSPPASPSSRAPLRSSRLLDQLRERIRYDHYSLKTEKRALALDALRCEEPRPRYLRSALH